MGVMFGRISLSVHIDIEKHIGEILRWQAVVTARYKESFLCPTQSTGLP